MKISLDALQILDAIDRRGSFTAAAKVLFKVPSTISYTVAKLEEDLGVLLFERVGPKATPTQAGRELLREGRQLLRAAQELEVRVRRVASGWESEFAIGLDAVLPASLLLPQLLDFYRIADSTRLRVVSESLSGSWEALLDRRVDLVVAAGEGPSGGGYVAEPIGSLRFVFAVAATHPLVDAGVLGVAELASIARSRQRTPHAGCCHARWGCCPAATCLPCRTCRPSCSCSWLGPAMASCPSRTRAAHCRPAPCARLRWKRTSRTRRSTWRGVRARRARR